jgi:hypothetical protein
VLSVHLSMAFWPRGVVHIKAWRVHITRYLRSPRAARLLRPRIESADTSASSFRLNEISGRGVLIGEPERGGACHHSLLEVREVPEEI